MTITPLIDYRTNIPRFLVEPPNYPPGYNRNLDDNCMLGSNTDWEVILEFLREYAEKAHTYRSYAKELERFSLWLIHVANKPISEIRRTDWLTYCEFIEQPKPYANWCNVKQRRFTKTGDLNHNWRPFEKRKDKPPVDEPDRNMPWVYGLSTNASKKAKKIIESFYSYLVDYGYLAGNPVLQRRKRSAANKNQKQVEERFLDVALIDYAIDTLFHNQETALENEQSIFPYIRARYIIQLMAGTGLRIEESATHTMGNIKVVEYEEDNKDDKWILNIVGKGEKPRSIELLPDLIECMREFRNEIGIGSPTPLYRESTPLIPQENLITPIGTRRIDQILKWAFKQSVDKLIAESKKYINNKPKYGSLVHNASILDKASAHWLRHSHATYFLKHTDGDLKATMDRLGHADVGTTMIYQHIIGHLKK